MSDATKKLVLAVVAVVAALGAVEVVLRVMDYGAIRPELNFGVNTRMALDQGRFLADPDLFWKMPSTASSTLLQIASSTSWAVAPG